MKNSATESDQDAKIQQNITNWQTSNDPLAPLTDQQLDIIYEISDLVKDLYVGNDQSENASKKQQSDDAMLINSNRAYIKWLISIEDEIKYENLAKYQKYDDILTQHKLNCQHLYDCVKSTKLFSPRNNIYCKFFVVIINHRFVTRFKSKIRKCYIENELFTRFKRTINGKSTYIEREKATIE